MDSSFSKLSQALLLVVLWGIISSCDAQLSTDFYSESCPDLFPTVKSTVHSAIKKEARMGASLLRLFFHDCFVNGCDGSLLLDGASGEKNAAPNVNSARGFDVMDDIKSAVENVCPDVVSCADILAIAARDSVVLVSHISGRPQLGRRDARTASQAAANSSIPPPASNLKHLISSFKAVALSTKDMVALSGAHTIGLASCTTFRAHLYNESNIDCFLAKTRQRHCPSSSGSGDNNLAPLDVHTPTHFDNKYFKNLIGKRGLLHSDQQLFSGGSTDSIVWAYSKSSRHFRSDFVEAMIKMGDISPLTGSQGEIRQNCRKAN
ncbi:peroxidase 52 [Hibiscus trionum]|uniref:Peroxidase n=1 Tax=Hibiscus trionum TaxID=183268 RepID=A0A9W7IA69_HIBTR|nr:peroxidase 52 [Hibiscus trionum]